MTKPTKEEEEEDLFDFTPEGYRRSPSVAKTFREVLKKVRAAHEAVVRFLRD